MRPSLPVRIAQVALIVLGVVLTGASAAVFATGVPSRQWLGVLVWLGGAVVLHDAVFAPLVLVGTRLLRRAGAAAGVSWGQVAVVQIALVIGAALSLVAFPGIRSQQLGARSSSVLVFPYALHLAIVWAVLGGLTAAIVLVIGLRRRRA